MPIEHDAIPDSELHEPKGAAGATANKGYVSDGLGSGSFKLLNPYGSIYYKDFAGTSVITTPTSYTLIGPTTTTSKLNGFTQNSLGRLTYTGTDTIHVSGLATIAWLSNNNNLVHFIIYKNGAIVDIHETVQYGVNTYRYTTNLPFDLEMETNDYIEVYTKAVAGNVDVKGFYFEVRGMNT